MKCPNCSKECKKGYVESKSARSITNAFNTVTWYPEESKGKLVRKESVSLERAAEAYYCDECMKVYATFDEK